MARLLFVSPYLPWPLRSGGRIRIHHLMMQLASAHEIGLFAIQTSDDRGCSEEDLRRSFGGHVASIDIAQSERTPPWRGPFGVPREVRAHAGPTARRALQCLLERFRPDAVQLEHSWAAGLLPDSGSHHRVVVDEHNIESRVAEARIKMANPDSKRSLEKNFDGYEAFERSLWCSSDMVLVCNPAEAGVVREVGARRVALVPNGIDLSAIDYLPPSERPANEVVFVGYLGYEPNGDAVRWLCDEIVPRVRASIDAHFTIVGGGLPEYARGPREGVTFTGAVADVRPYYRAATAVVAPLRLGAGTNLKTLEALASGAPLVATPKAVAGFEPSVLPHCLVAPDAEGLAGHLVGVLRNPSARDGASAAGRSLVERHFAWSEIGNLLRAAYDRLLAEGAP